MKRRPKAVRIFKRLSDRSWDIQYYIGLSPEERLRIARELRERYYGANPRRIRDVQDAKGPGGS